ncbi:hypothetical protein BJX64DRAFT_195799 [Aspergillus heterothallicus]
MERNQIPYPTMADHQTMTNKSLGRYHQSWKRCDLKIALRLSYGIEIRCAPKLLICGSRLKKSNRNIVPTWRLYRLSWTMQRIKRSTRNLNFVVYSSESILSNRNSVKGLRRMPYEEIAQARSKIEELEEQKSSAKEEYELKISKMAQENQQMLKELSELRERTNLSQQNWLKEKDELLEQGSYLQSEFEQAKEAMHNWEVLAMEERSIRENLGEKVIDLEEQLATLKDSFEKASAERESQAATVDGLQRALQEIQTARKQELRELVESSDSQIEQLKQALSDAKTKALEAEVSLQDAQGELERVRPFEKEVREKNLLIGKLRHEAVTLNDHLTKALRFLKRGKPEDNVDRHIVTNHLLHFFALDRSDPKKFQILQLIAALLGWSDEQREQAGLTRPGASGNTGGRLRVPGSPMHRTPSTPTLATEFMDNGAASKESLAELWSNFLEQESQASRENS